MRRLASLLILVLGACGGDPGHQAPAQNMQNIARPAPAGAPARPTPVAKVTQAAPNEVQAEDSGLSELSPAQRRAYDLGYRDCSQGRYAPDNRLEAYRIGCGAAHDRMADGRPQG